MASFEAVVSATPLPGLHLCARPGIISLLCHLLSRLSLSALPPLFHSTLCPATLPPPTVKHQTSPSRKGTTSGTHDGSSPPSAPRARAPSSLRPPPLPPPHRPCSHHFCRLSTSPPHVLFLSPFPPPCHLSFPSRIPPRPSTPQETTPHACAPPLPPHPLPLPLPPLHPPPPSFSPSLYPPPSHLTGPKPQTLNPRPPATTPRCGRHFSRAFRGWVTISFSRYTRAR